MNKQLYLNYCKNHTDNKGSIKEEKAFDAGLQAGLAISMNTIDRLNKLLNEYQTERITCYRCGNNIRGSHYADGC